MMAIAAPSSASRLRQPLVQFDQPVEQAQGAGAGQQQAGPVHRCGIAAGAGAAGRRCRHIAHRHPDRGQAERHHHEEDRAPAEQVDQHAADAGPQRRCQHHPGSEDAHGPALFMGAERPHDDDGRYRLHYTGSQTFGDARRQYQWITGGQPPGHPADQQQPHGAGIGAPITEAAQHPWRGQHRHGHGHHEARGHPLGAFLADGEMVTQIGHGHVDDGRGHDARDRTDHHGEQQQPAITLAMQSLQLRQGAGTCQNLRTRFMFEVAPPCSAALQWISCAARSRVFRR